MTFSKSENSDITAEWYCFCKKCGQRTNFFSPESCSCPQAPNGAPEAPKGMPRESKRAPKASRMTPRSYRQAPQREQTMHKVTQQHHAFLQAVTITPEGSQKTPKPSTRLWVCVFVNIFVSTCVCMLSHSQATAPSQRELARSPITDRE